MAARTAKPSAQEEPGDDKAGAEVPRLRFPEFARSEPWRLTPLGEVLTEHGLKSDGKSEVHSVSLTHGVVPQVEHMGRSFAAADTSHYTLVRPFDVVYTRSPLALFPLGIVKQHRRPGNAIVSPLYGVFSPKNRHVGQLVEAFFDSPARSVGLLDPLAQKGAKNTIQLSNERFLSGRIYLPGNEREQQKIADCLTSLDEAIAAQGRKVEALKAHKKGVMQHLFPREGQTLPRLRFPEFRGMKNWTENKVGALVKTVSPPAKIQTSGYLPEGRFPIIDQSPSPFCGWTNDEDVLVVPGTPLIIFGDHTCTLKLAKKPFAQGADGIKILAAPPEIDSEFLYHALQVRPVSFEQYRRHFAILQEKTLFYPTRDSGEQQRIADCLTSLDAAIAAASSALAALKTHKKGLMIQLFPQLASS